MSMPNFPKTPNLKVKDSIVQIISSIAMEELALSHVINAEGEKLQHVLGTLHRESSPDHRVDIEELLKINESINATLTTISINQLFLLEKLSLAVEAYKKLSCLEKCGCHCDDDDDDDDNDDDDDDDDDDNDDDNDNQQ